VGVKKVPARSADQQADQSAIVRDLRVLVEANRKLREEVSDMVSHRPRADLRAYLDEQRRGAGRRPAQAAKPRPRRRSRRR
jgi:hypothetical protein